MKRLFIVKDITALITDSVKKAENGTELVNKTKEVFSGVVKQVRNVFSTSVTQVKTEKKIPLALKKKIHPNQRISNAFAVKKARSEDAHKSFGHELAAAASGGNGGDGKTSVRPERILPLADNEF